MTEAIDGGVVGHTPNRKDGPTPEQIEAAERAIKKIWWPVTTPKQYAEAALTAAAEVGDRYEEGFNDGWEEAKSNAAAAAAEVGAKDYVEPKSSKVIPVIVAAETMMDILQRLDHAATLPGGSSAVCSDAAEVIRRLLSVLDVISNMNTESGLDEPKLRAAVRLAREALTCR